MNKFKKLLISLIALAVLITPVYATYQTFYDFVYMGASGLSVVDNSGANVVFQMQTNGDFDMYGTETIRGDSPADGIKDLLNFSSVDNAVTNLTIANAVTGSNAVIGVESTDTDTGITVSPKGTGQFKIDADLDLTTGSVDIDVIDNNATAVSFDSAGSVGLIVVDTTTGTPGVTMSGYLTVAGGITGATSTIEGAVPSLIFIDTDTADEDDSAAILTNCTDTGSGTEDCDVTFQHQVAGADVNWLVADADGNMTFTTGGDMVLDADVDMTSTIGNDIIAFKLTLEPPGGVRNVAITGIAAADVANFSNLFVQGNGGAITITATPSIPLGTNGSTLCFVGNSDANTLTFQDNDTLAGSQIETVGNLNITLGLLDQVCFKYWGTYGSWLQSTPYMDL